MCHVRSCDLLVYFVQWRLLWQCVGERCFGMQPVGVTPSRIQSIHSGFSEMVNPVPNKSSTNATEQHEGPFFIICEWFGSFELV